MRVVFSLSFAFNIIFLLIIYVLYSYYTEELDNLKVSFEVSRNRTEVRDGVFFYKKPFTNAVIKDLASLIDNGSVFIVDNNDNIFLDYNSKDKMTPASTLKIATSFAALHYLGNEFRFKTVFKLDKAKNLYIKGYGDPTITSKVLSYITNHLKQNRRLNKINSIYIDGSYFPEFIMVPGNENTYESYDSKNGALAVNFNTIALKRFGRFISSDEEETPYVNFAGLIFKRALAEDKSLLKKRSFRIAIKEYSDSLTYFGHLFRKFCKEAGIKVRGVVKIGELPKDLPTFYVYRSRQSLKDIVNSLMIYSNNYVANQLLIMMGAQVMGGVPSLSKGVNVLDTFIREKLLIDGIRLSEGSGISYANKVTARQMVKLLSYFRPYKHLLKELDENVYVKSGGLKSVSSYVGYIESKDYGELRFAILLNQSTNNRDKLLAIIKDELL